MQDKKQLQTSLQIKNETKAKREQVNKINQNLKMSATPALQTSKAPDSCTVVRLIRCLPPRLLSCQPTAPCMSSASWGPRSKGSPPLQTKGGHSNTSDPSERTHRDKSKWWSPCFLLRTYKIWAASKRLGCKQRGQRFAVNSLPGRKTFSSKETIYLE